MNDNNPKISVIVPVYKAEQYVGRCIQSIMSQTMADGVECLIIDDKTPDKSMEIVGREIKEYGGGMIFRIISNGQNIGIARTRNRALDLAAGKYVYFVDSDDYIEPCALEKLYALAAENDADVVVADHIVTFQTHEIYKEQHVGATREECINALFNYQIMGSMWNKLIRSKTVKDHHIRCFENIQYKEDVSFMVQLFHHADRICHLNEATYHFNLCNADSLTHVAKEEQLRDWVVFYDSMKEYLTREGVFDIYRVAFYRDKAFPLFMTLTNTRGRNRRRFFERYKDCLPYIFKIQIPNVWRALFVAARLRMFFAADFYSFLKRTAGKLKSAHEKKSDTYTTTWT